MENYSATSNRKALLVHISLCNILKHNVSSNMTTFLHYKR